MTQMWIDTNGQEITVGQLGFLVERSNPIRHTASYTVSNRPPYTNQSHQPRLYGWCGSWNDTNTYGRGIWRVVRICANGRAQLVEVTDRAAITAFLDEHGYPALAEQLRDNQTE